MEKKLAGTLFVHRAIDFDYCVKETVQCLQALCDHVYIVDAGSTDETPQLLKSLKDSKTTLMLLGTDSWMEQTGKEKLNFFTNVAIGAALADNYEWQINLQADEIIHEKSFSTIRKAINEQEDGFFSKRINLWRSPYLQLNVPHNRLPCSTEIVRLARTKFLSYGDAESIAVDFASTKYLDDIRFYHMGFVRDRKIMKDKVIHIQEEVFGVGHDAKLDGIDYFEPDRWFDPKTDLKPIDEPLPEIIQDWAKQRIY